ncbi:(2Fe-2S)-binding protein [Streptomyces gamaensis]|uniref:(2Fe-2S)-binding protein n=1 Tax=Streptomyces gamaensis TaxID=1763542 RepID=A0ABW0YZN2_9ACTN
MARIPAGPAGARPGTPPDTSSDALFEITFDGRGVTARPGQSVAAALWAAGILAWRTTREGRRPRGVFCGIGVCFDCLATVNGRPNRRACLVPARPGDAVTTQEGHGHDRLGT